MQDQASSLREITRKRNNENRFTLARVLAVTSGKGGVGKSNMSSNLAIAICQYGKKVLLIDFDLGLANIDVLFGIYPKYTLKDVLRGTKELADVIVEGPEGLMIIPASSGVEDMVRLTISQKEKLIKDLNSLRNDIDIVVVDTGSGIYSDVIRMLIAANEIIIITTPEPTAITDAYSVIKVISRYKRYPNIKLFVNMCKNILDAKNTGKKITEAAKRFLGVEIEDVWAVPFDYHVQNAVRVQKPFVIKYPDAIISSTIKKIAGNILSSQARSYAQDEEDGGLHNYFQKLIGVNSAENNKNVVTTQVDRLKTED